MVPASGRLLWLVFARSAVFLGGFAALAGLPSAADAAPDCSKPYSYAGLVSMRKGHGIRATITQVTTPNVTWGHVAAWVGVGGRGAGPRGETEWIQVGMNGLYGGDARVYYEVTLPGRAPSYTEVDMEVRAGDSHRVAVAEVAGRRDVWAVRVDGTRVGDTFHLPGSHGRWQPMAMAESWNAGLRSCNRFAYRFSRIAVATRQRSWRRFEPGDRLEDPGYRVRRTPAGFVASARW